MGLMTPPQRRQAATRWQTNTTVCILCVGGSPKLGPATTLAVPSVGRGPRIGRIRHRTHPQRRQNSKICTADDGKPSTASSEIQNLSQHRRLPPPASPESQVSAQQRRLRSPHIRNRTSDHRIWITPVQQSGCGSYLRRGLHIHIRCQRFQAFFAAWAVAIHLSSSAVALPESTVCSAMA